LSNVALHGMEQHLKQWIVTKPNYYKRRGTVAKQRALTVVRYADGFEETESTQAKKLLLRFRRN
jgi:hypothetical protein